MGRSMQGIEAIGEAVTGGMAARAVEPHAGGWPQALSETCLNCGTGLIGDYCHRCGQQGHVHRTLSAFWHDVMHGVLHFEGKIWRTLPMLAFRPGELTRRYVSGERARFVSPMALFLFSVFLMFAVLSISGTTLTGAEDSEGGVKEIQVDVRKAEEAIAKLQVQRDQAAREGRSTSKLDEEIFAAKLARDSAAAGEKYFKGDRPLGEWKTGIARLDKGIAKANANPSLLFYKLQTNAYKFSWALIPISVPFVWLLFLHRRRYRAYRAYDHVVFVTYSISFMSLGFIALLLWDVTGISSRWMALAVMLIPPLHIYKQLKGAYRLSRWSALWRTFMMLVFVALTTSLFFLLLLTLGVLG
ncbi:MAG: Gll1812 protein [uncultured Sphingosinicella sp.]|uniref:Gll1812 protein n=1 Tax=uncultured Sphingosinicella sp. TaxID=478748 RepID=A0A6J4TMU9_9SPHN|nr:DUF3667 domain-containing protein [uncultured Sphingosinicella sp.]CAA9528019.1 MAG: Gll1812 protein [uncultured Sphingosinicella sp.]